MIDAGLLTSLAVAEAMMLLALGLLAGADAVLGVRRRQADRRVESVAGTLLAAVSSPEVDEAAAELGTLPARLRLRAVARTATLLHGEGRHRLTALAEKAGITARAKRWCAARRWSRRLYGARVLTLLGGGERILPELLDDPRPEVRAQAIAWVGHNPEPLLVARLVAMLGEAGGVCRFTLMDALVRAGEASIAPLARELGSASGRRAQALLAIGAGTPTPRLLAPGLALCTDAHPRTRALAAQLVAGIGGGAAATALMALLDDPAPEPRAAAACGLGALGHWPAAAPLAARLRDPAWIVRRDSALALRGLGAPGILLLRRALRDDDAFARDIARQTLDRLASPPAAAVA